MRAFDWLLSSLEMACPSAAFKGAYFDYGNRFGVCITLPNGDRTAFRFKAKETLYQFEQVFPVRIERQHEKALEILEKAGIGWWIPDEDYLNLEEKAAWDKAVAVINALPEEGRYHNIIFKEKPYFDTTERKTVMIENCKVVVSDWIQA